jgi:hypothetical protein
MYLEWISAIFCNLLNPWTGDVLGEQTIPDTCSLDFRDRHFYWQYGKGNCPAHMPKTVRSAANASLGRSTNEPNVFPTV